MYKAFSITLYSAKRVSVGTCFDSYMRFYWARFFPWILLIRGEHVLDCVTFLSSKSSLVQKNWIPIFSDNTFLMRCIHRISIEWYKKNKHVSRENSCSQKNDLPVLTWQRSVLHKMSVVSIRRYECRTTVVKIYVCGKLGVCDKRNGFNAHAVLRCIHSYKPFLAFLDALAHFM